MILQLQLMVTSVMNSFLIELIFFFRQKLIFAKLGPLPTSKMKLFVRIVDS